MGTTERRKNRSQQKIRHPASNKRSSTSFYFHMPSKRTTIFAIFCVSVGLYVWLGSPAIFSSSPPSTVFAPTTDWNKEREEVKQAFIASWDAYEQYAFGKDRFHPISKTGSQMSPNGLGWIIVDSLDTMMIMNLTTRLATARRWVWRNLDYDQDQDVNTFETTIRMLGGLLSAHYLSTKLPDAASKRDSIYLSKSIALADRLLGAYDSASGVPYASVQLDEGRGIGAHDWAGASSTAETTTLQIEMKYLSHLTGNATYWRKAERVMKVVDDNMAEDGLVPIFIDPNSGRFSGWEIRLGSRGDSYYEYLIKQYLHTSEDEPIYLEMWQHALAGIKKHLVIPTKHSKLTFIAELPQGIGSPLSPKMDHLVCFLPGAIALGVTGGMSEAAAKKLPTWNKEKAQDMLFARELMKTCWGMYKVTETGIAPEIAWFNADEAALAPHSVPWPIQRSKDLLEQWKKDYVVKPLDAHNLQRPETVESLFVMWRITGDLTYRKWGREMFQAFKTYGLLDDGEGFSSLDNVNAVPPPRRDNMESFWLAETLKYFYLLFSPDDLLPLSDVVFNTEAHVMPRIKADKFGTGWQRKPRSTTM